MLQNEDTSPVHRNVDLNLIAVSKLLTFTALMSMRCESASFLPIEDLSFSKPSIKERNISNCLSSSLFDKLSVEAEAAALAAVCASSIRWAAMARSASTCCFSSSMAPSSS